MLLSKIYLFIILFTHPHDQPGMYIIWWAAVCCWSSWEACPGSRVGSPHFKLNHVYVRWPPRPQVWLCGGRIVKQPKSKANSLENSWKWSFPKIAHGMKAMATIEIRVVVLQEAESRSTSRPSYTTLGHIPKGLCILPQRSLLIHVPCWSIHISQTSETASMLSRDGRIMKTWGIYTVEYHFSVRKNELLIFR